MTAIQEIQKLEAKKKELTEQAHQEAMEQINTALEVLKALGYSYQLIRGPLSKPAQRRRSGIRSEVLKVIQQYPDGITRADLLEQLEAKGDKAAEQSISNSVAALKKAGEIEAERGLYTPKA